MKKSPEQSISIMVVDDESTMRETISDHLQEMGYDVRAYDSGSKCIKAFEAAPSDIVITDVRMHGTSGLTVLNHVKELSDTAEVILITAYADKDIAIEALRKSAFDFFEKPLRLDHLTEAIKRTARYQALLRERDALAQHLSLISEQEAQRWGIKGFVGRSKTIREILKQIEKLQRADRTAVLIQGESGTGKELIARALHFGGSKSVGPFVPLNCSVIPGELAESTLFGHVRGAFTGANQSRKGYFELADGGTLFLDEIADLPLEIQPKLLRVVEDGVIMPVGDVREKRVNARILASTNADLRVKVQKGLFREDLYFRLAQFTVTVPPLRDRPEDIPLLADHFLNLLSTEMRMGPTVLSPEVLATLKAYHFPGNVRELKNIIERALIESGGAEIQPEHMRLINSVDISSDEDCILEYVKQHGSMSNAECRKLLKKDRHRISYQLNKMQKAGLLVRRGSGRGVRYYLR